MITPRNIILSFDLDNTLINNRQGIVNSFNFALQKFNLPLMKKRDIEKMIGIPLHQMFLTISKEKISELVLAFREYYGDKGIYQSNLIMGVKEKLGELKEQGFTLVIITSKKQEMAIKMVDILAISEFFDYVIGETEERKELGKLDPSFKNFFEENYPNYQIIVIGDHPKDAMLSNNLKCPFIGVLTGNHSAQELKDSKKGKSLILNSVRELNEKSIHELVH